MSDPVELKKTLHKKTQALARLIREYKSYREECEAYDLALVSQDRRQFEFYEESKGAMNHVSEKVFDFYHQLKCFMMEN
jgi:hypothetical protein